MQTLQYKTNIKEQKKADWLILQLRQIIADFVIRLEREKNIYILTLEGNREVSNLVLEAFARQEIEYHFIPANLSSTK